MNENFFFQKMIQKYVTLTILRSERVSQEDQNFNLEEGEIHLQRENHILDCRIDLSK